MKKLFLIAGLVIALAFGGGFNGISAGPKNGHVHTNGPLIVSVSIEEVMCPCGSCSNKAINCGCGAAAKALKDAGFTSEDIEKYLENNQSV